MQANLTYILIDIGAFIIPFIFSFHPKIKFYKEWDAFWPANLIVTLFFLLWDIYYTKIGVWGFNDHYILGFKFFGLPLEEILFFICIPYSSVFTYHCFKLFYPKLSILFSYRLISIVLFVALIISGSVFISKLYTGVTFIFLALVIAITSTINRSNWLAHFYFTFLVILLPFFVVNGILTGTGIDEPVVWYNDNENMGIRILTIPFEDVFYGMLLLMLNTFVFESFRKNNDKKKNINISI